MENNQYTNPYDKHPNAQKWTAAAVYTALNDIEKEATEGESLFLGKALTKLGHYRHIWAYWKKTYYQNDDIMELMLRIESIFEAKLLDAALKKQLSPWIAVLALKNTYFMTDKPNKMSPRTLHHKINP
jgi:hypothetical protein